METGSLKIVKTVDLNILDSQINETKTNILKFATNHYKEAMELLTDLGQFKDELKGVYSLMGSYSHRDKRSINFIGSGLKFLFGTMDHEDEKAIHDVVNSLGRRQDTLHSSMVDTVHLMGNMSKQWELMRENQKSQADNFNTLRKSLEAEAKSHDKFGQRIETNEMKLHFESLYLAIQAQIDRLKTSILFLKSGVVDPYLVDHEELFQAMSYEKLGYKITLDDIDTIIRHSKPSAVFEREKKVIHILFKIPIVDETKYRLYENLVLPKVINGTVVVLRDISKFIAISTDNSLYFKTETLDCLKLNNLFISKNRLLYKTFSRRSCETSVFVEQSDAECRYKEFELKFETHNAVGSGFVIFSSEGLSVDLKCPNYTETTVLINSNLIIPPTNCNVSSSLFEVTANTRSGTKNLINKFPKIICCSKFFKADQRNKVEETIKLKSLHDLKTFDNTETIKQLNIWEKFKTFDYKENAERYTYGIILICLAIVIAFSWFFFKGKRTTSGVNVVVSTNSQPTELKEIRHTKRDGYPVF